MWPSHCLGGASLLVLAEPTVGLDVESRHEIWKIIRRAKSQGCGILITTHYMGEAEILAGRVAIINGGKIIDMGTPDTFLVLLFFAVGFREWISISLGVLALLIIAALNTISIGLLISSVTRTERTATAVTSAITWPISFITGIFFLIVPAT